MPAGAWGISAPDRLSATFCRIRLLNNNQRPLVTLNMLILSAPALLVLTQLSQIERPKVAPPIAPVIRALGVPPKGSAELTSAQAAQAKSAGEQLVSLCPHCRLSTIEEVGSCGWARTNKGVIKRAAALGLTAEQIVDTYVKTYGRGVLSIAKDRGLAAASWRVPIVFSVATLGLFILVGLRARKRAPLRAQNEASSEDHSILRRELEALD